MIGSLHTPQTRKSRVVPNLGCRYELRKAKLTASVQQCGQGSWTKGMAIPQFTEITNIIVAARSHSDAIDLLFRHYSALPGASRDEFVLALAAELMVQRAMKRAA
jgi:hypothetical protein